MRLHALATPRLSLCLGAALLACACEKEPKLDVKVAKTPGAEAQPAHAQAQTGGAPAPGMPAGHPPVGSPGPGSGQMPVVLPGGSGATAVVWTVPAGWKNEPPANPTRRAQYRVPGPGGDGECVVFYFGPGQGGDPTSNADRWANQFEPPAGNEPAGAKKMRTLKIGGLTVLVVEVSGTYLAGSLTGGAVERRPDWALLGAVVEGPDANWYFKLTGPRRTVDSQRAAFEGLLNSLKRGS